MGWVVEARPSCLPAILSIDSKTRQPCSTDSWGQILFMIFWLFVFISACLSNLTSHFSKFTDLRELQTPNTQTKCYEILPAQIKITHDKNHKIANQYFEFEYHFSTLPKILITFEQGCIVIASYLSSIAFDALSISSKVANSVEWSFLNPYWFSWDRLFSIK